MQSCLKVLEMWIGLKLKKINRLLLCLILIGGQAAVATVPSLNQCPDMVFIDGHENTSIPSNGTGGGSPGNFSRTITVDATEHTYTYYVPSGYQISDPIPLLAVWHGAVLPGGGPDAALDMVDLWQDEAETHNFIVVAQAAIGSAGCNPCGWIPGSDSQVLAAIINDMEARYNIETTRRYVWGFSAGGHVMHAIALNSADYFAAYAISAGVLDAFASGGGYVPANAVRIIPAFVSVGNTDTLLPFAQDDQLDFTDAGWVVGQNYWLDVFTGGHVVLDDLPEKAWNKICISTNLDE